MRNHVHYRQANSGGTVPGVLLVAWICLLNVFLSPAWAADAGKLVEKDGKPFGADPRGGPWASVIRHDKEFAARYAAQCVPSYLESCEAMKRNLFDRDPPFSNQADLFQSGGWDSRYATAAGRTYYVRGTYSF